MKKIGMIGGMSWESSLEYYRMANELVKKRLGEMHSCRCLMESVDFAEIEKLQHENCWEELTEIMISSARTLEKGGADLVMICTNTMHLMAEEVQNAVSIPLLHIADAAGERIKSMALTKIALLGTRFTMEKDFYKVRLKEKFGIEVLVPDENDKGLIHNVIYNELVRGVFKDESRGAFINIIENLKQEGAQGVILGCTEIPLLIKQKDAPIPVFDTSAIHIEYAVELALS
jgi:aspartate racemase